jgi:hypothetical protein
MKIMACKKIFRNQLRPWGTKLTMMRTGKISTSFGGWLTRTVLFASLLCFSAFCWASQHSAGSGRAFGGGGFQSHPQAGGQRGGGQPQGGARPAAPAARPAAPRSETRPGYQQSLRPGQEHLPAWWQSHRGQSPTQKADALRREPGFRSLPQDQQQRLLNRLHSFDSRPPAEQQRMMDRNEMFERLSPERQQDVRGAAQALARMPADRQAAIRHSFQQLRAMPPDERQRMLGSAYGSQFSPQERTVLGNMLSIEPYQPRVYQPYFGR